jgi:hypothetical protein
LNQKIFATDEIMSNKRGEKIKNKSPIIGFRPRPEFRARLETVAKRDGRTLSGMIKWMLKRRLDEIERAETGL